MVMKRIMNQIQQKKIKEFERGHVVALNMMYSQQNTLKMYAYNVRLDDHVCYYDLLLHVIEIITMPIYQIIMLYILCTSYHFMMIISSSSLNQDALFNSKLESVKHELTHSSVMQ